MNASNMIKEANKIQKLFNVGVYCPANDFLQGIVDGNFAYNDYFDNTEQWLKRSDAVYVVPGSEKSKGTQLEIKICEIYNIPVFYNINDLKEWLNRPIIITICGESGSGKTEIGKYIKKEFKIYMIQSYTDRPKRNLDEDGHNFISKKEFNDIEEKDMIAYTKFGDYRYCATKQQINDINTYIVDEKGLCHLKTNFKNDYRIISTFVDKKNINIDKKRKSRDEANFFLNKNYYDIIILNNKSLKELFKNINNKLKIIMEFI